MQTIVLVMHMRCGTGVRMRSDLRHPVGGERMGACCTAPDLAMHPGFQVGCLGVRYALRGLGNGTSARLPG